VYPVLQLRAVRAVTPQPRRDGGGAVIGKQLLMPAARIVASLGNLSSES